MKCNSSVIFKNWFNAQRKLEPIQTMLKPKKIVLWFESIWTCKYWMKCFVKYPRLTFQSSHSILGWLKSGHLQWYPRTKLCLVIQLRPGDVNCGTLFFRWFVTLNQCKFEDQQNHTTLRRMIYWVLFAFAFWCNSTVDLDVIQFWFEESNEVPVE